MQLGGALANVIVLGELPSAAGHGVSPVSVAPAIVLGSGVNVVVGRFGSMVVVVLRERIDGRAWWPSPRCRRRRPA